MGAAASLSQIPEDLLVEGASNSYNNQLLTQDVLSAIRRKSTSNSNYSFPKNHRLKRNYEIPGHVSQFLDKIGISDSQSPPRRPGATPPLGLGNSPQIQGDNKTTKLVGHIFECLGALQHLVRANQSNFEHQDDETQSVSDMNTKSVGKLMHEMVTIYGLCGDTLKVLLDASPESAAVEDNFGRLPLHLAVDRDNPWMTAVQCLTDSYPEALMLRDGGGRLPLHIAVDRPIASFEVVSLLVKANPTSASARRGVGRLPIHYAVFSDKPSIDILCCLYTAFPEGVETADVYGRLPLHYAVDKAKPNIEVIDFLLQAYPQGASIRDSHKRLPLTIAVERDKVSIPLVHRLCAACPDGLKDAPPGCRLPLQVAVDMPRPVVACVRHLAQQYPEAALVTSRPGRQDSPLALSISRNLSHVTRAMLLHCPSQDPDRLRDLNWFARRVAFSLTHHGPESVVVHRLSMGQRLSLGLGRHHTPRARFADFPSSPLTGYGGQCNAPVAGSMRNILLTPAPSEAESDGDEEDDEPPLATGRSEDMGVVVLNMYWKLHRTNMDIWRLAILFL